MNMHDPVTRIQTQPDSVEAVLVPIRAKFRHALVDHIGAFEALLAGNTSDDPTATLQDIAARSHKMAGVAATLGFSELGKVARKLEATILGSASEEDPHVLAEALLAEMRTAAAS